MTLIIRRLLTVIILASLLHCAYSQQPDSARSFYDTGASLVSKNPHKAFELLEQAMNSARRTNDRPLYVMSLNKLASLKLKDREERVFAWLKEAVEQEKDSNEDSILAELHFNTADYYERLTNEIELPILHYQKAKKIWTALKGEWSAEVSHCYHGLGNIYKYYKFDFYEAEKCYEKALLIREKIGFDDLEVLYKNYYSLAATNRSQQDFEKALSYGSRALALATNFNAEQLGPLRTEMSNGMVANIYRDMNQSELAKAYYLKALALSKKNKDLGPRASYYNSLGETFKNDSLYSEATEYFKAAYAIYKNLGINRQTPFLRLLINMAETYSLMGDDKNFSQITKESFAILDSLKMSTSVEASSLWLLIGAHQQRKENYDSALFYFQKSLVAAVPTFTSVDFRDNPSEEMIGVRYQINETLIKKGLALKGKFQSTGDIAWIKQSLDCLRLSEKVLSRQRNDLDMEDAKWRFLESKYDIYEDIISSLYECSGKLPDDTVNVLAFQYFEQSKSRSLADALAQTELTRQISVNDSLLRVHADLKRRLFGAQDAVTRELDKADASETVSLLREEVVRLDQEIQAVKYSIEEKYPGYFNVKYGYQPVPLASIKKVMASKNQVLLEYFWGNESIYAIGVRDELVVFKRIGSPDSIAVVISELLSQLTEGRSGMNNRSFDAFTHSASELYRILIKPFAELMRNVSRMQIIPDGTISQIPFEILLEERPQQTQVNYRSLKYLIKSFTIGYAYSSVMFVHDGAYNLTGSPSLLAIGLTDGHRFRDGTARLGEIIGAEEELKILEKRFGSGKFLVGHDATETNFKTMAPDFDIIHLAIHGSGDIKRNFAASLYFRSQQDSLDDGELHAYELYGLKLKALMAVLTSCESGLGKGYKGEGMISMASAFTFSGCENILMSLWKVNDQVSAKLMDDFYQHLLDGKSIDEALRQAKLNYLNQSDELTSDPKIWAPLIAYGNLGVVFQKDRKIIFIAGALAALTIVFLALKFNKQKLGR